MLKIKEGINLNEMLPKYGFKYVDLGDSTGFWRNESDLLYEVYVKSKRFFVVHSFEDKKDALNINVLYDMISDGIIEKENENITNNQVSQVIEQSPEGKKHDEYERFAAW